MANYAVIFDVDGVLLHLTEQEEELFFEPFATRCDAAKLSRDWNSYRIRNDENIVAEIVERNNLPQVDIEKIKSEYLNLLSTKLAANSLTSQPIEGAAHLLANLSNLTLGVATANFREAAKLRLSQAGLWQPVSNHAFGADGGGAKSEILGRTLNTISVPKSHIIYIGDNVHDVEAGLKHNVHFIAFSEDQARLRLLHAAGAIHLSSNHNQTFSLIREVLSLAVP